MAQVEPPVTQDIPQTVNINGVEYSPEDAQSLIELGNKAKEYETKLGSPIDKVVEDYEVRGRSINEISAQRDEARQQLQEFQNKKDAGVETPADVTAAKEAARKLGLILNEDLDKAGYIKADQLPSIIDSALAQRDEVKKILDTASDLEKQIDGSDGRPKFNKKAVLAYASAYNIPDLTQAYEDMNKADIDTWKSKQVMSQKNKGLSTFSPGGTKSN